ncbi:MAG: DUF1491 family protein [Sphingorhabdus sp.]
MIEPRLATNLQISALIKITEAQGGFATVLHKGDSISGAILLIARIRGENPAVFERYPSLDGGSLWQAAAQKSVVSERDMTNWLRKRCDRDPDLWLIELDVADDKRLADIIASSP